MKQGRPDEPAAGSSDRRSYDRVREELARQLDAGQLELPLLPEQAARVVSLASSTEADAQSLARLITADQALAAQVMRVARSAAYRAASPVNSLQHAITWLGLREVADIAFTVAVQARLLNAPGQRPRAQRLWRHALAAAVWSREIAMAARRHSEVTYLCGLLHDIGKPVALLAATATAADMGIRLDDEACEQLLLEFHGPMGLLLAERWNLPQAVAACIRLWPDYGAAPEYADEVRVVHLAHHLAAIVLEQGAEAAREALQDHPVLAALGLGRDRFNGIIDRAGVVTTQVGAY